jgi:hypothetical protein
LDRGTDAPRFRTRARPTAGESENTISMMYTELENLDAALGLPLGTISAVFVDFDQRSLSLLNEKLAPHGIRFDDATRLVAGQSAWQALCQRVGLGSEWWMAGHQEPPDLTIPSL